MRLKHLLYALWLILLSFATPVIAEGQTSPARQASGKVIEAETDLEIVGASVRLLNPKDSTLVAGTTSGMDGGFTFRDVHQGQYLLHITYIGFDDYFRSITKKQGEHLRLNNVVLQPSSHVLDELTITGQASTVVLKTDTVQFSTDAFKVRQGASVEDLLRRIPGMEVSEEGEITYNGEKIERLELDGRNFFSGDPTMGTRNLPAEMIQNVQVVDKKSEQARLTGMDDGEKVKVLNLEVKEDKKGGMIANANVGYGTKERYKADALFNIFDKSNARYTLLANFNNIDGVRRGSGDQVVRRVGANYDNKWGDHLNLTAEGYYFDNDHITKGSRETEHLMGQLGRNFERNQYLDGTNTKELGFNSRLEWSPWGEQGMIVFEPNVRYRRNQSEAESQFNTKSETDALINEGFSESDDWTNALELSGNLHLRHTFNDLGRNIYVRLFGDYSKDTGEGNNFSKTSFVAQGREQLLDQQSFTDNDSYMLGVRVAYLEPFSKQWSAQLTYGITKQVRNNSKRTFNKDDAGLYTILDPLYSRATYNNNVNQAFGVQLRYSFWGNSFLSVGAQANPTYTHTISSQGEVENFNQDRTVWNYAPRILLQLKPNRQFFFYTQYSGRSSHPSMTQLNPAVIQISPLVRTMGNPDLLPAFSHRVRFNSSYNMPERRIYFNLQGDWSYTQNGVAVIQNIDRSTGQRETTYSNVDGNQDMGVGFMLNVPIGGANSKWSNSTHGFIRYSVTNGFVNNIANRAVLNRPGVGTNFSWRGDELQFTLGGFARMKDLVNSFSTEQNVRNLDYNGYGEVVWNAPFGLSLSTRLTYQDAYGYTDGMDRQFWLLDASLSYSFLKGRSATIELSGQDLLEQRTSYRQQISNNSITNSYIDGVKSYVMLTFSYRFNNMGGSKKSYTPAAGERRYGPGRRVGGGRR